MRPSEKPRLLLSLPSKAASYEGCPLWPPGNLPSGIQNSGFSVHVAVTSLDAAIITTQIPNPA